MSLAIDHVVIYVHDVNAAIETYRGLGFTAFFGGKHASGITHNGLVVFDDGSYLELVGLVEPGSQSGSEFNQLLRSDNSEGYTGFALLSDALEADIVRIGSAGVQAGDIRDGSRARPDGELIQWKSARLDAMMSPFVIQDVTPRPLRVPAEGSNIEHENGVVGIAEVHILVDDLATAMTRYAAISGSAAMMMGDKALFALASGTISLAKPANDAEQAYFQRYGSVPYQLTLIGQGDLIDAPQAHGARFVFTG